MMKKKTVGYKIWSVGFAIVYPILSVFTFVFTIVLQVFSWLSQRLVWVLSRIKP